MKQRQLLIALMLCISFSVFGLQSNNVPAQQQSVEQLRLDQAATCAFVKQGEAVIITGPTGTRKSWLATALGNHACVCGHKTRYFG